MGAADAARSLLKPIDMSSDIANSSNLLQTANPLTSRTAIHKLRDACVAIRPRNRFFITHCHTPNVSVTVPGETTKIPFARAPQPVRTVTSLNLRSAEMGSNIGSSVADAECGERITGESALYSRRVGSILVIHGRPATFSSSAKTLISPPGVERQHERTSRALQWRRRVPTRQKTAKDKYAERRCQKNFVINVVEIEIG